MFASTKYESLTVSETTYTQKSLSEFVLRVNFEKSIFYPTQNENGWESCGTISISVPERRLRDTVASLQRVVKNFLRVTSRGVQCHQLWVTYVAL